MYEFAYLLKLICDPKINTCSTLQLFADMARAVQNPSCPSQIFPAKVQQGAVLFQLSYCKQARFCHLFSHTVLFLLEILLFKMPPSIVVHKEIVVWLIEKMCVRWASFRHEFQCCWPGIQCQWINNNISIFKQKHTESKVMCFSSEKQFKYCSWRHSQSVYRTNYHK